MATKRKTTAGGTARAGRADDAEPSRLELLLLALVERDGPVTAYRIRRLLEASPTAALSASAGSVYPAVRRLEERGLLAAGEARDGRGARRLRVTAAGRRRVRRWLREPEAGGLTEDPLRRQALFVARLPPRERRAWLRRALEASLAEEAALERFARRDDLPPTDFWAHDNPRRLMAARIEWLRAWLESEDDVPSSTGGSGTGARHAPERRTRDDSS